MRPCSTGLAPRLGSIYRSGTCAASSAWRTEARSMALPAMMIHIPSKHDTFIRLCYYVGPALWIVDQHYNNAGIIYPVRWDVASEHVCWMTFKK